MAVCLNCGREIKSALSIKCPYCGAKIELGSISSNGLTKKLRSDYDCVSNKIFIISIFIPLYGFIYYKNNREIMPLKSKSAIGGAFVNLIILIVITIVIFTIIF